MRSAVPAILLFILTGPDALAADLVRNPGFTIHAEGREDKAAQWNVPRKFQGIYQRVNDDGHNGNCSLRYMADAGADVGPVTQEFACEPDTDYMVSAAFKSDGRTIPAVVLSLSVGESSHTVQISSEGESNWTVKRAQFNSRDATRMMISLFGDSRTMSTGRALAGRSGIDDVLVLPVSAASEETAEAVSFTPPGPNIALGKRYTLSPAPTYPHCTGTSDAIELTDGVYTAGYFWTQETTVGWRYAFPVLVKIDLGTAEPIAGISYNTAAGVAGVTWPTAIGIFVSENGETWTYVGDLVRLGTERGVPDPEEYSVFRFATGKLRARGRYLQLAIQGAPYIFTDEIEVYRGPDEFLEMEMAGKTTTNVVEYFRSAHVFNLMIWRLRADLNSAREKIKDASLEESERKSLTARADGIGREIEALPDEVPDGFQTVLPLSNLHERIYALNAPVLRSRGLPSLSVWQANRWDPLTPTDAPRPKELRRDSRLVIRAMRGEVRGAVLNITNAGDEEVAAFIRITGLPGGPDPDYITVHEVPFTDTKDHVPLAAALPPARHTSDGYRATVFPGCSRQVWFSFRTETLEAAEYEGHVEVRVRGEEIPPVPIGLVVYPFDMPPEFTIAIGGWDYTDGEGRYDAGPGNIPLLIRTLREYGVNTPWATNGVSPGGGTYDPAGNLTSNPDFTRWDEWVGRWPDAKHYCVFLSVGGSFEGEKEGTSRFNRMVGDWARAWVEHIRSQGIDPTRLGVLLVDEPRSEEQTRRIITWARPIKASAPEIRIWEDPVYVDPEDTPPELLEVCDVICPNLPLFMGSDEEGRRVYMDQHEAGKELWFYSCSGPGRQMDPSSYHRGQFWWALRYGAVGSCYWAFGDEARSGNSWNSYLLVRAQYSPLFLTETTVTRGKHMEAIREGAQDYEYFMILQRRIEFLEAEGKSGPLIEKARDLLRDGPGRVVSRISPTELRWNADIDRGLMDEVRVTVLELLVQLEGL